MERITTVLKFLPLVWAALWRNRTESVLTLLALSVAFALFGTMITVKAAYERAIDDTRMDRLIVSCAFDCAAIPIGYREQLVRIPGVTAVSGEVLAGGWEQDQQHKIRVLFVDKYMRQAWPELPMSSVDWRAFDIMPTGIFLTPAAAARRNVKLGDTVTMNNLPGSRADGSGSWPFTVAGFIPDPPGWGAGAATSIYDPETIVGNLQYLENTELLVERGIVNFMRVAIDRPEHAHDVCREIDRWFTNATPALNCVTARDDAEETAEAEINMRQVSIVIGGAGLFMIVFLCANGIAESVRERLWEFGVMKAIGFDDGRIALLVLLEASIPVILAAVIGSGLARTAVAILSHLAPKYALNMPPVHASSAAFAYALAAALIISLISAVAPLHRIRRTDIATVIAAR
jgi:putative ABC transport system permease protein